MHKFRRSVVKRWAAGAGIALLTAAPTLANASDKIVHDAEYYILEAQNNDKWAVEDKSLDEKLAEFRKQNGGAPPHIFYILIDDIGFGDLIHPH